MRARAFDVVHVGSASRDLTDADPRGWRLGGGVSYAALTTARLGLRTCAVIGVDAITASAAELGVLREAGVEIQPVPVARAPAFRNEESASGRVQTLLAAASPIPTHVVQPGWRDTRAWSLVPVAEELPGDWAQVPSGQALVVLGWQGLLRTLIAGEVVARRDPGPSRLLDRADIVGVSRHDLAPDAEPAELLGLLEHRATLVVTDGLHGGEVLRRRGELDVEVRPYEAIEAARTVDPTGAGDVFLAAFLAVTVRPDLAEGRAPSLGFELQFAAAAASLVVEAPGLDGVPTLEAVRARLSRG